jgi:hypothetical protein
MWVRFKPNDHHVPIRSMFCMLTLRTTKSMTFAVGVALTMGLLLMIVELLAVITVFWFVLVTIEIMVLLPRMANTLMVLMFAIMSTHACKMMHTMVF